MLFSRQKATMIEPERALRGGDRAVLADPTFHEIFGIPVTVVGMVTYLLIFGSTFASKNARVSA